MMPTDPFPVVPKVIPASLGALWLLQPVEPGPVAGQLVGGGGVWRGQEEGAMGMVSTRHVPQVLGPRALFWGGRKATSSPRSLFPLGLALSPPQSLRGSGMHPLREEGWGLWRHSYF